MTTIQNQSHLVIKETLVKIEIFASSINSLLPKLIKFMKRTTSFAPFLQTSFTLLLLWFCFEFAVDLLIIQCCCKGCNVCFIWCIYDAGFYKNSLSVLSYAFEIGVFLAVYLFIYVFIYLLIYLFDFLFIYLLICLFIYLFV